MRQNYSTDYLLPIFFKSKKELTDKFIDSYILDVDDVKWNNKDALLYVLFDEKPFEDNRIEYEYKVTDNIGHMYVYKIPEYHVQDYCHFLNSDYSKFTLSLKDSIREFHGNNSWKYKVVIKHPERRAWLENTIGQPLPSDAELLSAIDINNETFNKNALILND